MRVALGRGTMREAPGMMPPFSSSPVAQVPTTLHCPAKQVLTEETPPSYKKYSGRQEKGSAACSQALQSAPPLLLHSYLNPAHLCAL